MAFLDDLLPEIERSIASPAYASDLPRGEARPPRSLRDAIDSADGGWALLLEHKRESPGSSDPHLPRIETDALVDLAESSGVAGLSCLATAPRFAGAPEDVARLARRSRLPVLFKDFVIDPVQIDAARRAGAAAVLLIARLETERRIHHSLSDLADRAHAAGLEVVLEFHAAEELDVAQRVDADVYGINLRDLGSLQFRPDVVAETFRRAGRLRPLIGMSGIGGPEDAARFRRWGADGVLVGTGLARAADPRGFIEGLKRAGADGRGGP